MVPWDGRAEEFMYVFASYALHSDMALPSQEVCGQVSASAGPVARPGPLRAGPQVSER